MPLPIIEDGDWSAVRESMRMMASTINRLRKRVEELERAATAPAAPAVAAEPSRYGTYTPSPLCAMCSGDKEPGRTALTCKECAVIRTSIIANGIDRAPITRTSCFCCATPFKAQTRFLCPSCTRGHKMFVASH